MILKYLIVKEFKQMWRNVVLPIVFILLPLGIIILIPRAATQEVRNLKISVVDNDHSTLSSRLIQKIEASEYFHLNNVAPSYDKALHSVEAGSSQFIIEIESGFEKNLISEGLSRIMISANAVNGVNAGLGSSYLLMILEDYSAQIKEEHGLNGLSATESNVIPRYLFNTRLDYKVFMIPGLMAMLLILLVGFLPALNIVGEKERGTIEQINVTPVTRHEFILSKLIPYWCVGLFLITYSMLLTWRIYDLIPAGSITLIYMFTTLFILVVSCCGLIVSNYSETTQQAALVMFFFLVIFILMSGLITPVASMPEWAKAITQINPLYYFIKAMRMLYLKGSGFADLSSCFAALSIYASVVWTWAIISYRKNS